MSDLIDKKGLIEYLDGEDLTYIEDFYNAIRRAPAVDAVEVVRCRDCSRANQYDDGSDNYVCRLGGTRKGSDFCSEGERREENE